MTPDCSFKVPPNGDEKALAGFSPPALAAVCADNSYSSSLPREKESRESVHKLERETGLGCPGGPSGPRGELTALSGSVFQHEKLSSLLPCKTEPSL